VIQKIIQKIQFLIAREKGRVKTKRVLQDLKKNNNVRVQKMALILEEVISRKEISEGVLTKVYALEQKYANTSDTIDVVDYGAGEPDFDRSQQTQEDGVITTEKISYIHKMASSKRKWGHLIFKLIRTFQPTECLELGTCLGVSAAYQITALQLNNKGFLTSIEGSSQQAELANKNLTDFQFSNHKIINGKFSEVLPSILDKNKLIDFVFIDGHHDKEATETYFNMIYPYLSDHAIVIFDDINWSQGMKNAWSNIYKSNRIDFSFDVYQWGICSIDKTKENTVENHFELRL